jgi:hypothetical protein
LEEEAIVRVILTVELVIITYGKERYNRMVQQHMNVIHILVLVRAAQVWRLEVVEEDIQVVVVEGGKLQMVRPAAAVGLSARLQSHRHLLQIQEMAISQLLKP